MPFRLLLSAILSRRIFMKALTYHGPHHVSVDTMPDPALEAPDDIILRVTATAICGSDLHLYRGKIPGTHHGDIFGHEFMGEVVEAGSEVTAVRKGDRVVIPFVIACGDCFCRLQYAACESTNSGQGATLNRKGISPPAALLAIAICTAGSRAARRNMRVPKANTGPFKVPDTLPDEKVLFLSDILPTAWQAVKNAEVKPGSSVAIFGAGPVGLLCASCARLNGAEQIFIIDHNDYRLDAQQRYGAIPINFDHHDDPAQWIIDNTPAIAASTR
jgi:threonine dehydrogenase-like Zn-dependent dehydrogenase